VIVRRELLTWLAAALRFDREARLVV